MKPTKEWFLGIDLGTGSCKAVVTVPEGDVIGFGSREYEAAKIRSKWEEQDPEELFRAAVEASKEAVQSACVGGTSCAGLSLGGALHSLMAIDQEGKPLTGVITWADSRASKEALGAREGPTAEKLYRETGCPAHPMYPLFKIIWLREHRRDLFKRTWRFISAKEYVVWRMTGEFAVDFSIAAGSGLLDVRNLKWSPMALDLAGIGEERLSQPSDPKTRLKGLKPDVARHIGIGEGAAVFLGSSDAVNSSLGAGAVEAGQATCMIGTSGALRVVSPGPIFHPKQKTWCYAIDQGHWLVGGAINNGGVSVSWLTDLFRAGSPQTGREMGFKDVVEMARKSPPGAEGVLCLPFFAGERSPNWNLNARGVILGLGLGHGAQHLSRAVLEGIGFRLKSVLEALGEMGILVERAVASGGFTRSDLWLQITSDVLGIPLHIPQWGETSSLGAAFWAMLGAQLAGNLEELARRVPIGGTIHPRVELVSFYDDLYRLYKGLYRVLIPFWEDLAHLRRAFQVRKWNPPGGSPSK